MIDPEIPMIMERQAGAPDHVGKIAVGFGYKQEKDGRASDKAGYPVFKDVVFCQKYSPGDKNTNALQPATDDDKKYYPNAYKMFLDRNANTVQGMPIEQWPQITRSMALSLRAMAIQTVEMLAEINDQHIIQLGQEGRELREKAKAFILNAKEGAAAAALAKTNQELRDELAETKRMMADLAARVEASETRRGPGRPPKEAA